MTDSPQQAYPVGKRLFHNVLASGAIGNGVTDDTAALQAAINAAAAYTNDTNSVYLPAGTYRITKTLTWDATRVQLTGQAATIVCDLPAGQYAAKVVAASTGVGPDPQGGNYPLEHSGIDWTAPVKLDADGTELPPTVNGILFDGTSTRAISNVQVSNMLFRGFKITHTVGANVTQLTFRDCVFTKSSQAVTFPSEGTGRSDGTVTYSGCDFAMSSDSAWALSLTGGLASEFTNCSFDWITRLVTLGKKTTATFTACHFETPAIVLKPAQAAAITAGRPEADRGYARLDDNSILTIENSLILINYYEGAGSNPTPFLAYGTASAALNIRSSYNASAAFEAIGRGGMRVNISQSRNYAPSTDAPLLTLDSGSNLLQSRGDFGSATLTEAQKTELQQGWGHHGAASHSATIVPREGKNAIHLTSADGWDAMLFVTAPLSGQVNAVAVNIVARASAPGDEHEKDVQLSGVFADFIDVWGNVYCEVPLYVTSTSATPSPQVDSRLSVSKSEWTSYRFSRVVTDQNAWNPARARQVRIRFVMRGQFGSTLFLNSVHANAY